MEEDDPCLDDHSRTIIHIDMDCFYAQVEMIKNPELRSIPFAVNQKSYIVTSNYVAREYGLKKMMLVQDAKKVCPNLRFIKGEDLHDYRKISYKVTELIQKSYTIVERLAIDENFIDVSDAVKIHMENQTAIESIGNIFGETTDLCDCGCEERLKVGTMLAQQLRDQIKTELQLTTCAGIAHNKLLAKLVGSIHKPNQQTVIFPNNAVELMLTFPLSKIPGMGAKSVDQLGSIGINSVEDLQNCDFDKLSALIGHEKAQHLYDMSFGLDHSSVKPSGKPQSIGIEDCKPLSTDCQVKDKLRELLDRLLILVAEDGRIPGSIKLTVRQVDKVSRTGNRQTRQCNISRALFNTEDCAHISETTKAKIIGIVIQLFNKLVDTGKPYHLTLLGLSLTKFVEKTTTKTSLIKFLEKNEVQSNIKVDSNEEITHTLLLENSENELDLKNLEPKGPTTKKQFILDLQVPNSSSNKALSLNNFDSGLKSSKNNNLVMKKRCASDYQVFESSLNETIANGMPDDKDITCPPDVDEAVFRELPRELQQELWNEYQQNKERNSQSKSKKIKPNSILNYLVKW